MITILETKEFGDWLIGLRDQVGRRRILQRLTYLRRGNFGDAKPLGDGLHELRFHFGPGYRVYYARRVSDNAIVLLLAGGDKDSQQRDIRLARTLADREM